MISYDISKTAERIKNLRKKAGYTQEQVAELLNVDHRHVARLENGTRGCSVDMLLQISQAFDVSVDYLLTGKPLQQELVKQKLEASAAELLALIQSM